MNNTEEQPMLGTFAVIFVIIAVAHTVYTRGLIWWNEFEVFFASIWPVIYATMVSLAVSVILFFVGKFALEKWKAHQKFIFELRHKIVNFEAAIEEKSIEVGKLEARIERLRARNKRLKNGLARYHRLLVKTVAPAEPRPKVVQAKVKHAMASILEDFGASTDSNSKGALG